MQIIKRGQPPEDREIEWTCKNCHSVMKANVREGQLVHDRDGTMVKYTCPVCKKIGWGYL